MAVCNNAKGTHILNMSNEEWNVGENEYREEGDNAEQQGDKWEREIGASPPSPPAFAI